MSEPSSWTYSPDHLGGSFKTYFIEHAIPEKLGALKKGLDDLSCQYVDFCIESALHYPDLRYRNQFGHNLPLTAGFYPDWLIADVEKNVALNPPSFGYGLNLLPQHILERIKGKIFLDLGAYDGWSVYEMEKFEPRAVHSFDISKESRRLYLETSKMFRYPFFHHLIALSDQKGMLTFNDEGSSGTNLYDWKHNASVETLTLDEFSKTTLGGEAIGFIKMDIEGSEMKAVMGGLSTLRRDRPVLSISIYHNPTDFFEIKPVLEALGLGYRFLVRKLSIREDYTPFLDTVLIAYPEDLGVSA